MSHDERMDLPVSAAEVRVRCAVIKGGRQHVHGAVLDGDVREGDPHPCKLDLVAIHIEVRVVLQEEGSVGRIGSICIVRAVLREERYGVDAAMRGEYQ